MHLKMVTSTTETGQQVNRSSSPTLLHKKNRKEEKKEAFDLANVVKEGQGKMTS